MFSVIRIVSLLLAIESVTGFTATAPRSPVQSTRLLSRHAFTSSANSKLVQQGSLSQLNVLPKNEELAESARTTALNNSNDVGDGSIALSENHIYETAIKRTLAWVAAAFGFGAGLFLFVSPQASEEFYAGYLLEQSLSVDNLLVFLLLFEYFKIPSAYENRVLNWGIIGAIFMRAIMIGVGAVAIQQFHAVLLGFAAILIYSSAKILLGSEDDEEEDFSQNTIVKFSNNIIKSTNQFDGDRFFTELDGVRLATPMFLCMVAVEFSDVVFAVDSVPAVFGVTEVSTIVLCFVGFSCALFVLRVLDMNSFIHSSPLFFYVTESFDCI
jgi:TerC family integral membrane protein